MRGAVLVLVALCVAACGAHRADAPRSAAAAPGATTSSGAAARPAPPHSRPPPPRAADPPLCRRPRPATTCSDAGADARRAANGVPNGATNATSIRTTTSATRHVRNCANGACGLTSGSRARLASPHAVGVAALIVSELASAIAPAAA